MKILFLCALLAASTRAYSAESHIVGTVTDITSYSGGLLIRVDGNKKPTGCSQGSAWMVIKQADSTMIAVVLATYMANKRDAVVYVNTQSTGNYCEVTQYDPQNQ